MTDISKRMDNLPWDAVADSLHTRGNSVLPKLLSADECADMVGLYGQNELFRKRIVMEKHGYGRGEYQYFAYPLPGLVSQLRSGLYTRLAPIANHWYELMKLAPRFPPLHDEFIGRCHAAGQLRPTPLILRYREGDYNCLHQDLYGEQLFPLQMTVLLSRPGQDFSGGEFLLTEQRPRMQSRAEVIPLQQGDAVVIAVNQRPVSGTRGHYRVNHRHGVSTVRSGERYTMGIIFHDAK